ncbi:MAG: cadherin-like domain-containing protein [Acidobacteria bacterium]|nr:cadherin-like domain-containing protein [Acidobacteriota bacterium]
MNHLSHFPRRRNVRAFTAAFISYVMLVGQVTPLALAVHGPSPRPASKSEAGATATIQSAAVPQPLAAVGPIITATKVDSFPDPNNDGKADPGAVITYTVTVSNTGTADATAVQFTDSVDTNTTLVPGSVNTQPIATDDAYNVIGNVRIQPNAAAGLLANDRDPDTGNSTGLTASGPTTTTQGGNITINGDGSFSYNPPPGFTGTDTVTYTITDTGGKTDTAVATFTVGNGTATPGTNVIWFVNSAAATNGDGRLTNPFNCLRGPACFDSTTTGGAADDPGDLIFLFASGTAYAGGLTLLNNQKLIGQGASATLDTIAGVTVPPNSDPLPVDNGNPASVTITTTVASTNGINIATGASNTLRGFTVGNTTGAKVASPASPPAAAFGTLTVLEVALSGSGQALNLDNGTLAATFISITSTSSGTQGIILDQITGSLTSTGGTTISGNTTQCLLVTASTAAMSFGNTSCTGGTDGISLQNNTGANVRSFGTLSVSGGSGSAFLHAAGGGNTTVSGAATLASAGNPVDIQNAGSGQTINFAGGATVSKTTAGGAGVNWGGTNTGATLTFASLGLTTSNGPGLVAVGGGTINVTTGSISSTGSAAQAAPAINSNGVTLGATFTSVSSTNSGNAGNGIALANTPGTLTMSGGSISGAAGDAFLVFGVTTSTANITYNGTISAALARPVNVANKTAGTVTFGGAVSSTANGVLLNSNTGATINFTGGLNLSTAANDAFTAVGGGTVTATQNNTSIVNTLTTTTGTALKVTSTTIGASGLTFRSINSPTSSANNGIILDTTGSSGGLTVTGNGGTCTSAATCTGGTISNKTGANGSTTQGTGIFLNSTSGVSLDRMQLNDFQNNAIRGTTVTGFSLTNSNINGANGNNNAGGAEEGCIRFDNLFTSGSFPTAQITGSTIGGGGTFNVFVQNTTNASTLNRLVMSNNTFGLISSTIGNDNVDVIARPTSPQTATLNVSLLNNTFLGTRGDFFEAIADGNSTMDTIARQNKFTNGQAIIPGGGVSVSIRGDSLGTAATHTFDISCNRLVGGYDTVGMFVAKGNGGGTFTGTVVNNAIGAATVGSNADGMFLRAAGSGTFSVLVQNNTITGYTSSALHLQNNDGSSTMNASIFGNSVTPGAGFPFSGLFLDNGATATDTSQMNVVVGSVANAAQKNDFSLGDPGNFSDISINNNIASSTLRLSRNGSAGGTATQVLKDNNLNPALTSVGEAGVITLVNTLPTVPATPATCSVPASPETFDGDTITGPGSIGTQADSTTAQPKTATGNNVTSRPFVSPRPLAPRTVAPTTTVARTAPATTSTSTANTSRTTTRSTTDPVVVNGAGGTVSVSIGTLRAGDSVTITFQVTVDDPYSGGPNVSNQGTVSGSNFSNVLTDDPAVGGAADPTLTPINSINIFARDGSAAEPVSGTTPLLFTVTLSSPAGASGVSVNYATANDTGGANPATGGAACDNNTIDYVTTNGTVSFATGEQVKTVSVTVCADAATPETSETLLLNLSGAVGGTILDAQAVGTITQGTTAGTFLISELRTSGPGGAGDDFVELYNNTNTPLTVAASDASAGYGVFKMGADCNATPVLIGTVPNGTIIPARGHYLLVGSQYGLGSYATGNLTMISDIETDKNVAVFTTADVAAISVATRRDAVGFDGNTGGGVCDLLREGNTLPPIAAAQTTQHSFFRSECGNVPAIGCTLTGVPKDTNNNAADFAFADTQGTFISGVPQHLGAPGPENLASPIERNAQIPVVPVATCVSGSSAPNRVRDFTSDPGNNSTFGTLKIRRTVTNNTGASVTRLRFRVILITTFPAPSGTADLRVRSSIADTFTNTCGATASQGLTLEQPPTQPNGGGLNSSLSLTSVTTEPVTNEATVGNEDSAVPLGAPTTNDTITLAAPLANGASVSVNFLLGIQQTGTFRFYINVEALP